MDDAPPATSICRTAGIEALREAVRDACLAAALEAYEHASLSGLCHDGAWEAALGAIRAANLNEVALAPARPAETLEEATLELAQRFAAPGAPAAGSAAAVTGAAAAGLVEWCGQVSASRGSLGFRRRAAQIAARAATLQAALSAAAQRDSHTVARWIDRARDGGDNPRSLPARSVAGMLGSATDSILAVASRCAQVASLAKEIAEGGHRSVRADAAAAVRLAAAGGQCALFLARENLSSATEEARFRRDRRRLWRVQVLLNRAWPHAADVSPEL